MKRQSRKKLPKARVRKGTINKRLNPNAPNVYIAQSVRSITIRTISGSAQTGFEIQNFQLAQLLGEVAVTTTTSNCLTALFRLKRVRMWGPIATAGVPVTIALTWENSLQDFMTPPVTKSDTSISFDYPAHLNCAPPGTSLASKWHASSSTNVALFMNFPINTIIDFTFDWVLNDDSSNYAVVSGSALIAAVVGTIYHHPIGGVLTPINVNAL
jgi:hypothetical protein